MEELERKPLQPLLVEELDRQPLQLEQRIRQQSTIQRRKLLNTLNLPWVQLLQHPARLRQLLNGLLL